jgi:4-hydroxythreonine-4-phosphate dehydrogenase
VRQLQPRKTRIIPTADNTDNTDLRNRGQHVNTESGLASSTTKRDPRLRIGITVGDPAGIGPEIARKAAADPRVVDVCQPVLYGPDEDGFARGRVSAEAGRAAYDAIVSAVEDARAGKLAAIATAPINKAAFAAARLPWRGHTELLAHLTGAHRVAMMFHADVLRVVLATIHIPLAEVPQALSRERLEDVIDLAASELPRFGLPSPRLALAGLNPHAGEHGLIGLEEDATLRPAVEASRRRGIDIAGPLPADTVFVRSMNGEFDAVIACYHDQGLIPIKLVAFGRAVNVTLGLPIIRTSVDHGTAFDIAGRGIADPSSLVQAVLLAARLAAESPR